MQTSDVLCVSVCAEGEFFDPLGCSYCLPPLCAVRNGLLWGAHRDSGAVCLCVCVWDDAGDLWCGEMFNTGVTHSAGPSFPLSAER